MNNYNNDIDIMPIYEKIEQLRKEIKENKNAMEIYEHLKEINKHDVLYGWMFRDDNILNDTLEDFEYYQKSYTRDILTVYKNELENILIKSTL